MKRSVREIKYRHVVESEDEVKHIMLSRIWKPERVSVSWGALEGVRDDYDEAPMYNSCV